MIKLRLTDYIVIKPTDISVNAPGFTFKAFRRPSLFDQARA